ncbi:pectinesterase protein [Spatholobus suberectus]|nr:pectinesterase protein [Spatholobus suberectus]
MGFNKNLLLIVSLSSLLLSTRATPHIIASSPPPVLSPNHNTDPIFTKALKATQQVVEFCSGTENATLCAETIAPHFQSSFDPIKALETEIEATRNQSMKVAGIIAKSLGDPSTDKKARDALDICKSQYKSIVDATKEAVELLNLHNVVDAYYEFSSVISDHSACEDAFKESPGVSIPFADDSFTVFQLGGNCLFIMDGMVNSSNKYFLV